MAGRGPAPKQPGTRARRNKTPEVRVLQAKNARQPTLPKIRGFTWPAQTRAWWKRWGDSPLSDEFGDTDWGFLLDTAVLHAQFWMGNVTVAGELRLREAKFGATPEDRLRLRIQFEQADEAEDKGKKRRAAATKGGTGKGSKGAAAEDPRQLLTVVS